MADEIDLKFVFYSKSHPCVCWSLCLRSLMKYASFYLFVISIRLDKLKCFPQCLSQYYDSDAYCFILQENDWVIFCLRRNVENEIRKETNDLFMVWNRILEENTRSCNRKLVFNDISYFYHRPNSCFSYFSFPQFHWNVFLSFDT